MNIPEKLLKIQTELKAPKNQFNSFGKYNYRSCEDILEGLKPLLDEYKATLIIADEIVQIGERYYVKATATLQDVESKEYIHTVAYAREDESKKGMDLAQVTGSTSSYARKYALNGLFAIDDTKDSDSMNTHGKEPTKANKQPQTPKQDTISEPQQKRLFAISKGNNDLVKEVLELRNLTSTKDIKKSEYEAICKFIETRVNG